MALKIGKYYGETSEMNNPPTIQIKETLDNGYSDVTSVETWMTVGLSQYDYLFCRDQAKLWLQSNPFSGLTKNIDKTIAAKHYLVEKTDRDQVLTEDEQFKHWSTFVVQSKANRDKRWGLAKNYASYVLSLTNSFLLAQETNTLSVNYREYGIESMALDGMDGLVDWFKGINGYAGGGLPSKDYHTQELEDKLVSIISNGY
jgi:hypothetical protein